MLNLSQKSSEMEKGLSEFTERVTTTLHSEQTWTHCSPVEHAMPSFLRCCGQGMPADEAPQARITISSYTLLGPCSNRGGCQ